MTRLLCEFSNFLSNFYDPYLDSIDNSGVVSRVILYLYKIPVNLAVILLYLIGKYIFFLFVTDNSQFKQLNYREMYR